METLGGGRLIAGLRGDVEALSPCEIKPRRRHGLPQFDREVEEGKGDTGRWGRAVRIERERENNGSPRGPG